MDYLVQFQINIFSIIILIVLFAMIRIRSKIGSFGKKILILAIYLTIAAAVVDPLAWVFDGSLFFGARFLEYSTNFVLVLLSPAIGAVMLSYVDNTIYRDLSRLKKRLFYSHFTILTLVILLVNIFVPLYFSVDFASN